MKKLIIIKHEILDDIDNEEIIRALPDEFKKVEKIIISVSPVKSNLEDSEDIHWQTAAHMQRVQFDQEIHPRIEENANCTIAYFGMAPIPLAIQMGYLIGPIKKVLVFQRHHETKAWEWKVGDGSVISINAKGIPLDTFEAVGDVIFRVKSSFDIHPELTTDIVKQHTKEVDIETTPYSKDIFSTEKQLMDFANKFSTAIDAVVTFLPKTDTIHLFAAVPVGLAFLLGTKINPNLHPRIQTYHHTKGNYDSALVVQSQNIDAKPLTKKELASVAKLRKELVNEYESIKEFVSEIEKRRKGTDSHTWATPLFLTKVPVSLNEGRWKFMPTIESTPILKSSVSTDKIDTGEQFYDDVSKEWMLDNHFLLALQDRLKTMDKIKQAFRLFIFHESLHFALGLSSYQATGIGRFPRVLEEADFYADVWAMLHEYAYTAHNEGGKKVKSSSTFFASLIGLALETFWAFDTNVDMSRPQIRRVNRYLLWYFVRSELQLLNSEDLSDTIEILSVKPIIDLRGPTIKPDTTGRTNYVFSERPNTIVSLSIYDKSNKIIRATNDVHLPLADIPKAFINRDSDRLNEILIAFCDSIKRI
jgi:hypothetical protein